MHMSIVNKEQRPGRIIFEAICLSLYCTRVFLRESPKAIGVQGKQLVRPMLLAPNADDERRQLPLSTDAKTTFKASYASLPLSCHVLDSLPLPSPLAYP
jgi:hypothetical protein